MIADIKTVQDLGIHIRGVVHIGANDGEETPYYIQNGVEQVALFEPLLKPFNKARALHESQNVKVYNIGFSDDEDILNMNITENDKASSTREVVPHDDPNDHPVLKDWNMGQLPVVDHTKIRVIRFDHFVETTESFDINDYNVCVIDVQGMEHEVLFGMGTEIHAFDAYIIECSEVPVYVGEASAEQVVQFMADHGFTRMSDILPHNDILFIKQELAG